MSNENRHYLILPFDADGKERPDSQDKLVSQQILSFSDPGGEGDNWSVMANSIELSNNVASDLQRAKTIPSFSDPGSEGDNWSVIVDNTQFSNPHDQLLLLLEQFIQSTTEQMEQLQVKATLAQKLLDELKK